MDTSITASAPRKPPLLPGSLGIALIVLGLACSPSFIALSLTPDGSLDTPWRVVQLHLLQLYAIAIGSAILIGYPLGSLGSWKEQQSPLLSIGGLLGAALVGLSLLLRPSFIEQHFSPTGFLEEEHLALLARGQLATLTLGCLLLAVCLYMYRRNLSTHRRLLSVLLVGVLPLYLLLTYAAYIREQYPDNILFTGDMGGKVLSLLLGRDILLTEYQPQSMLVAPRQPILKAKYPVIDIHFHLESTFITTADKQVLAPEALLKSMDTVGVQTIVNLDGAVKNFDRLFHEYHCKYPDRFLNFSSATKLTENVQKGARGLKVWKLVGLAIRDASGKLIPVDDPRNDATWATAGALRVPILWHIGDPPAFFQPVSRTNERFEELRRYPEWSFHGPHYPSWEELLRQREHVIQKHPETIFIGAHMGDNADNLASIARLLDTYPNYYVEISSRLPELGRQPYSAREFFIKYQDRILFGSDGGAMFNQGWTIERFYRTYFEFLETRNEYFDYPMWGQVNQGRWKIYGIHLPDEVLEKIYYKNAEKILSLRQPLSGAASPGCK